MTARHLERPRDPKTLTRRQRNIRALLRSAIGSPPMARVLRRVQSLRPSPTVQRLIGIYTARNPRTFRHSPRAWFFTSLRLSDYVCEYIPANRACDTVVKLQIPDYGKNLLFPWLRNDKISYALRFAFADNSNLCHTIGYKYPLVWFCIVL